MCAWPAEAFWKHRRVRQARQLPDGGYVVARIIGAADDWGRLRLHVEELADRAEADDLVMRGVLDILTSAPRQFIIPYGGEYGTIVGHDELQPTKLLNSHRESRLPAPPAAVAEAARVIVTPAASRMRGRRRKVREHPLVPSQLQLPNGVGDSAVAGRSCDGEPAEAEPSPRPDGGVRSGHGVGAHPGQPRAVPTSAASQPGPDRSTHTGQDPTALGRPEGDTGSRRDEPPPLSRDLLEAADQWLGALAGLRYDSRSSSDSVMTLEDCRAAVDEERPLELLRLARRCPTTFTRAVRRQLEQDRHSLGRGSRLERGPIAALRNALEARAEEQPTKETAP